MMTHQPDSDTPALGKTIAREAEQEAFAGPSNIGNYLAGLGIEATAGFGVDYRGLHGTDERIRIDSIPPVEAAYHQACLALLASS